jgi:hypothetical protein
MLNEEPVSRRLKIMAGWVRGMRDGTLPSNERTAANMEALLGECAAEVERMELETGAADVPTRLRAAGSNVFALKAALDAVSSRRRPG